MTFISHANLKDFFDLPFFPGNINTNSLDGTVNIRLYHRTEIFQNQFHCITAHSNIPAKRMTQAIRRISMGLIVVKFSTLVSSNSWHRLLLGAFRVSKQERAYLWGIFCYWVKARLHESFPAFYKICMPEDFIGKSYWGAGPLAYISCISFALLLTRLELQLMQIYMGFHGYIPKYSRV